MHHSISFGLSSVCRLACYSLLFFAVAARSAGVEDCTVYVAAQIRLLPVPRVRSISASVITVIINSGDAMVSAPPITSRQQMRVTSECHEQSPQPTQAEGKYG